MSLVGRCRVSWRAHICAAGALSLATFIPPSGLRAFGPTSAPARGASRASGEHREKLDEFWDRFRRAVRGRDKTAIALMTHFPFIVRWGDADPKDPTMEYDRDAFLERLDRLLFLGSNGRLMEDAVASGGSMTTGTMLEEIAAETPPGGRGLPRCGAARLLSVSAGRRTLEVDDGLFDRPRVVGFRAGLPGPFLVKAATEAPWLAIAIREQGTKEVRGLHGNNPRILEYISAFPRLKNVGSGSKDSQAGSQRFHEG